MNDGTNTVACLRSAAGVPNVIGGTITSDVLLVESVGYEETDWDAEYSDMRQWVEAGSGVRLEQSDESAPYAGLPVGWKEY